MVTLVWALAIIGGYICIHWGAKILVSVIEERKEAKQYQVNLEAWSHLFQPERPLDGEMTGVFERFPPLTPEDTGENYAFALAERMGWHDRTYPVPSGTYVTRAWQANNSGARVQSQPSQHLSHQMASVRWDEYQWENPHDAVPDDWSAYRQRITR